MDAFDGGNRQNFEHSQFQSRTTVALYGGKLRKTLDLTEVWLGWPTADETKYAHFCGRTAQALRGFIKLNYDRSKVRFERVSRKRLQPAIDCLLG